MEIRDISIRNVDIREVRVPERFAAPPRVPSAPPITEQVGVPVIDIPGCVEAHEQNTTKEKNGILNDEDPKGVRVFCDGNMPSFNPINYNPEELQYDQPPPKPPKVAPPETPPTPEIPKDAAPKVEEKEVECPPPNAPRIGDVAQNQKERVSGFELQKSLCDSLRRYSSDCTVSTSTTGRCDHCCNRCDCYLICSSGKTTGRLTAQSIQTSNQKGYG